MYQVYDALNTRVKFVGGSVVEALQFFAQQNRLGVCKWLIQPCSIDPLTGNLFNSAVCVPLSGSDTLLVLIDDYIPVSSADFDFSIDDFDFDFVDDDSLPF